MLNGEKNHLLELLLSLFQPSDILPFHVGNLYMSLSQRGRVNTAHREFEVLLGDSHSFKDLSVYLIRFYVDDVHLLPDTLQG